MPGSPKEVVLAWVDAFNRADIDAISALYAADAVNHQVAYSPVSGRAAIKTLLAREFDRAEMRCDVENLFEEGDWAILEWTDPNGLRGCGFFQIKNGLIQLQRGYFDRLTFYQAAGIPLEDIPN